MSNQTALIERSPQTAPSIEAETVAVAEAVVTDASSAVTPDVLCRYLNGLAVRSQLGELTEDEQATATHMWLRQEPVSPAEDEMRWDVRRAADRLKDGQRVDERHLALWGLTTIVSRAHITEHLKLTTIFAYRLRQTLSSGSERYNFLSEVLPPRSDTRVKA